MKKIKIYSEPLYAFAIILLAFAVALLSSAGFGVSMIVAPAYILSLKSGFLSFGQAEYVIQSVLFIVFCCVMKRFKIVYLSSFLTCLIYGAVLDLFRKLPFLNQNITKPEALPFVRQAAGAGACALLFARMQGSRPAQMDWRGLSHSRPAGRSAGARRGGQRKPRGLGSASLPG